MKVVLDFDELVDAVRAYVKSHHPGNKVPYVTIFYDPNKANKFHAEAKLKKASPPERPKDHIGELSCEDDQD
jgi:hypothetical protein